MNNTNFPVAVTPIQADRYLAAASIDAKLPYSYEEIQFALESEEWTLATAHERALWKGRTKCYTPTTSILKDIYARMTSDEVKWLMIKGMYDTGHFPNWRLTAEEMMGEVKLLGEWMKDAPGFTMPIHIDTRKYVSAAMLFFLPEPDSDSATFAFTDRHGSNPLQFPNGFGKGWTMANSEVSFHTGFNNTPNDRYSLFLPLVINFKAFNL